ncbi:MAG: hypothetical protein M3R06_00185 [Chloroflexota bacterium]|nr:hypothetical protein [Chloroflexota bacterium]
MEIAILLFAAVVVLAILGTVGGLLVREQGWVRRAEPLTRARIRDAITRPVTSGVAGWTARGARSDASDRELVQAREAVSEVLATLSARHNELAGRLDRLETGRDEVLTRIERVQTDLLDRHEAALHHLRLELEGRRAGDRQAQATANDPVRKRRAEAVAALAQCLARVEVGLAGVVNPVLLPGESLLIPAAFLSETLSWESWNETGERAFALGETFLQERLYLEETTAAMVEATVTLLRTTLTQMVYPIVHDPLPDADALASLRDALERLARDLADARSMLARTYQALTAPADEPHSG